jgi:hypothetical protein
MLDALLIDLLLYLCALLPRYQLVVLRHVCKRLRELVKEQPAHKELLVNACYYGHLGVAQWFHSQGVAVTAFTMHTAIEHSHMQIVEWLLSIDCDYHTYTLARFAARHDRADLLSRCRAGPRGLTIAHPDWNQYISGVATGAIAGGHKHWIEHVVMLTNSRHLCLYSLDSAVINGHKEFLEWFHQHFKQNYASKLMDAATYEESFDMVWWLRERGCPWGPKALRNAMCHQSLATIKRMTDDGCEPESWDLHEAIHKGRYDVARWISGLIQTAALEEREHLVEGPIAQTEQNEGAYHDAMTS